jgi:hypothetical protein
MRKLLPLTLAAVGLLLAGCTTDNATPTAGRPANLPRGAQVLLPPAKINAIAKGMTGDEVTQLLGKPDRLTAYPGGGPTGQVWSYNIAVVNRVDQISSGTREVPSWNPITNQPTTTIEPILTQRRSRRFTTLDLLFVDGHLLERRPGRDFDVQID